MRNISCWLPPRCPSLALEPNPTRKSPVHIQSLLTTAARPAAKIILLLSILFASIIPASAQNTVSFDNQSGEPALAKLIGPTSSEIEVPNGTKQSVRASAGKYFIKVRYGIPGKYYYMKGQEFTVDETAATPSKITITLHKVANGNDGSPITEQEFGAGVLAETQPSAQGDAALMFASENDHLEVVGALLDAKADVNAKRDDDVTALMIASENDHPEVVRALLDAKADVNAKQHQSATALIIASRKGYLEVVRARSGSLPRPHESHSHTPSSCIGRNILCPTIFPSPPSTPTPSTPVPRKPQARSASQPSTTTTASPPASGAEPSS
jgi:hypothetical protein